MDSGAIVVTESRQQVGILFGFVILAFAVALARGVTGAQTTSGQVAAAVFCSILVVAFIAGWIARIRHPARLEVTEDTIRYVPRNGRVATLSRQQGDELRFVKRHAGTLSRIWTLGLTIVGTDTVITFLGFFSRNAVQQACCARGWRFDDQVSRQRGLGIPAARVSVARAQVRPSAHRPYQRCSTISMPWSFSCGSDRGSPPGSTVFHGSRASSLAATSVRSSPTTSGGWNGAPNPPDLRLTQPVVSPARLAP